MSSGSARCLIAWPRLSEPGLAESHPVPLADSPPVGVTHLGSGKVRELYLVEGGAADGEDALLLVASDRMSVFDVVLPTPIPDKGAVLTGLSIWWFAQLADVVPGHLISTDVRDFPAVLAPYAHELRGRSMLCRRLTMIPVECVVRGYLAGGGLLDYQAAGAISGHQLPGGLVEGSLLPSPIYTPSTKAPMGQHDENITRDQAAEVLGRQLASDVEKLALDVFARASRLAEGRGLILADTKVEFGHDSEGTLRLGDEVLTPDSSRFWPAGTWAPGGPQPSFDKQFVRQYLIDSGLRGTPAVLPEKIVTATRARYVEAYERLTGSSFDTYLREN